MRYILSIIPYDGIPGHVAASLTDGKTTRFFSLNSETHHWIKANENPYEAQRHEDDLPYWIRDTLNSQVRPMFNSTAITVTDPTELSPELPATTTEILLSEEEYRRAQDFLTATEARVSQGDIRYSVVHRQRVAELHSCASITQQILAQIARPGESTIVNNQSFFERHISETPGGVMERARQLAEHRKQEQPAAPMNQPTSQGSGLFSQLRGMLFTTRATYMRPSIERTPGRQPGLK